MTQQGNPPEGSDAKFGGDRSKENGPSVTRPAEGMKLILVALNKRLLLGAGPAFELGFAAAGVGESGIGFDAEERSRRISCGGSTGLTGSMVGQAAFEVRGRANVDDTRAKTEKIDDRHARFQIRRGQADGLE